MPVPTDYSHALRGSLQAQLSPAAGTGRLLILAPSPYGTGASGEINAGFLGHEVVTWEAPPWGVTTRMPVAWTYQQDPPRRRNLLYVVAGPEVRLDVHWDIALASGLPTDLIPELCVLRAQSTSLVPDPGAPFRVTDLIGAPERLVNGRDPDDENQPAPLAGEAYIVDYLGLPAVDRATISPRPEGVVIDHSLGHWQLALRAPLREPARFAYEIVHARQPDILNRAVFHVRVVRTSNVQLDGFVCATFVRELLSTLVVEDAVVTYSEVPEQGSALGGKFRFRRYEGLPTRFSPASARTGEAVEMILGAVPIIGSVIDLAHLIYAGSTGETFWGEQIGGERLFAMGVFALLGVVFDADEGLQILKKISDRLAPGADLVKLNPGLAAWLQIPTRVTANPYLLAAIESLGPGRLRPMLDELDGFTAGRRTVGELTDTLAKVVLPAYDEAVSLSLAPNGVFREAFDTIHPAELDGFADLGLRKRADILDAFELHRVGARPIEDVLGELEGALWKPLGEALDEWRVWRVFDFGFDGLTRRLLNQGFFAYITRKAGQKNAVQWAIAQRTGRYADELVKILGADYRNLLKRVAPEKWLNVDDAARAHFAATGNRPNFYRDLVDANESYGHLFEADHLLEKRFIEGAKVEFDDFALDVSDFQAILVPKNPAVAAQLPFSYYNHQAKTQALRRLIPNGMESTFTLQEIYDAYLLVYIYELRVPHDAFRQLAFDFFAELRKVSGEPLDRRLLAERNLYARNPRFSRPP